MSRPRHNTQWFALPAPPPEEIRIGPASYRLRRTFKHDFFAATSLYEATGPAEIPKIVAKSYRTRPFCGLPIGWLGRFSRNHERAIYAALSGVEGVPRWVRSLGEAGCAIEYVQAVPLDQEVALPAGFLKRLRGVLHAIHLRGVAYVDANKLSNILVGAEGQPYLVDFQISLRRRDDWPWPLRTIAERIVRYCQSRDLYHLYKHKRRIGTEPLSAREQRLSRWRGGWHRLHRALTKPYRAVRRRFLGRQYRKGRLLSPTAHLEDPRLPEQQTWKRS